MSPRTRRIMRLFVRCALYGDSWNTIGRRMYTSRHVFRNMHPKEWMLRRVGHFVTETSTTVRSGTVGSAAFGHRWSGRLRWRLWLGAAAILMAAGIYLADQSWPYRYRKVQPLLEQVLQAGSRSAPIIAFTFRIPALWRKGLRCAAARHPMFHRSVRPRT